MFTFAESLMILIAGPGGMGIDVICGGKMVCQQGRGRERT